MNELERLEKIKLKRILLDYPFYGYFLIQISFELNEDIPTAETDGKTIWFNPLWTKALTDKQIITVILHEIKHIVFCHLYRINGRNISLWNQATDYVINYQLIYEEGNKIIEGMLLDNSFANKSAEEIYRILEENNANNRRCNGKPERSGKGNDKDNRGSRTERSKKQDRRDGKTEEEIRRSDSGTEKENESTRIGDFKRPRGNIPEQIEKIKEEITKAVRYAEKVGKMPGNMKREIDKLLKPQISWENLLANWMFEKARDDFSWLVRDNRIQDYYFPALEEESLGKIAIVIDVSGSINAGLYQKFLSEINGLKQRYSFEAIVISFDTKIQNVKRFNKYEPIKFSTSGGGGTAIKPVFDFLKKENGIIGCVIFTDLFISDLYSINTPSYDVLWMCYSTVKSTKFGKVVSIK